MDILLDVRVLSCPHLHLADVQVLDHLRDFVEFVARRGRERHDAGASLPVLALHDGLGDVCVCVLARGPVSLIHHQQHEVAYVAGAPVHVIVQRLRRAEEDALLVPQFLPRVYVQIPTEHDDFVGCDAWRVVGGGATYIRRKSRVPDFKDLRAHARYTHTHTHTRLPIRL